MLGLIFFGLGKTSRRSILSITNGFVLIINNLTTISKFFESFKKPILLLFYTKLEFFVLLYKSYLLKIFRVFSVYAASATFGNITEIFGCNIF